MNALRMLNVLFRRMKLIRAQPVNERRASCFATEFLNYLDAMSLTDFLLYLMMPVIL